MREVTKDEKVVPLEQSTDYNDVKFDLDDLDESEIDISKELTKTEKVKPKLRYLSGLIKNLDQERYTRIFLREFRAAARSKEIDACYMLDKTFIVFTSNLINNKKRELIVREMVFYDTPQFREWFKAKEKDIYTHHKARTGFTLNKQDIQELEWPIHTEDFAQKFDLNESTARMRLKSLVDRGELIRIAPGQFDLPENVEASENQAEGDSKAFQTFESSLSDFEWPMNFQHFLEAAQVEESLARGWIGALTRKNVIYSVSRGIYSLVHKEDIKHVRTGEVRAYQRSKLRKYDFTPLLPIFDSQDFVFLYKLDIKVAHTYLSYATRKRIIYRIDKGTYSKQLPLYDRESFTADEFIQFFELEETKGKPFFRRIQKEYLTSMDEKTFSITYSRFLDVVFAYYALKGMSRTRA